MRRSLIALCLLLSGCLLNPLPPPKVTCERRPCPVPKHRLYRCTTAYPYDPSDIPDPHWSHPNGGDWILRTSDILIEDPLDAAPAPP
jgi:hypothetical protein